MYFIGAKIDEIPCHSNLYTDQYGFRPYSPPATLPMCIYTARPDLVLMILTVY